MLLSTHIAAVTDITSLHTLTAHTDTEGSELYLIRQFGVQSILQIWPARRARRLSPIFANQDTFPRQAIIINKIINAQSLSHKYCLHRYLAHRNVASAVASVLLDFLPLVQQLLE